jgi:hypothetical protein
MIPFKFVLLNDFRNAVVLPTVNHAFRERERERVTKMEIARLFYLHA